MTKKKTEKRKKEDMELVERIWKEGHRTGSICFIALDHIVRTDLDGFVSQPTDGILYDLGLLAENTHILATSEQIDVIEFIDKLAYAEVISHISNRMKSLEKENSELKEEIKKLKGEK